MQTKTICYVIKCYYLKGNALSNAFLYNAQADSLYIRSELYGKLPFDSFSTGIHITKNSRVSAYLIL